MYLKTGLARYGVWAYTRRMIARSWGCLPWEVDEAPQDEVALELRILALEAKHLPRD